MKINSIEWHRDNLNNSIAYYLSKKSRLNREYDDLKKHHQDIEVYKKQIQRAEKEGKKSFDKSKYKC